MSREILERIATGEFALDLHVANADGNNSAEQFAAASQKAAKILGRSQDRVSKDRVGPILKKEGRTKNLYLDIRRFTTAIALGVYAQDNTELHSRVTVTEHMARRMQQKPFHPIGYGAIALRLFTVAPDEQEVELHKVVSKKLTDGIATEVNGSTVPRAQGIEHMLLLLDSTHQALVVADTASPRTLSQ